MVWTYTLAMAAGKDAANRQMRSAGRKAWSVEDWNLMVATVDRLHPERIPQHGPKFVASTVRKAVAK